MEISRAHGRITDTTQFISRWADEQTDNHSRWTILTGRHSNAAHSGGPSICAINHEPPRVVVVRWLLLERMEISRSNLLPMRWAAMVGGLNYSPGRIIELDALSHTAAMSNYGRWFAACGLCSFWMAKLD